jgi:hypothetical protein
MEYGWNDTDRIKPEYWDVHRMYLIQNIRPFLSISSKQPEI